MRERLRRLGLGERVPRMFWAAVFALSIDKPRVLLRFLARATAMGFAVLAATSLATGWLYWIRATVAKWPGPPLRDALVLDEMAFHDSVPLVVYVVVMGLAAVLLGLLARALKINRLVAGLGLALGVAAWLILADTIGISVVRQIPAGTAFQDAAGLQAIYLAAALCGAAAAALGVGSDGARDSAHLVRWAVAVGGGVDLLAALFPPPGSHGGHAVSTPLASAAHVLMVPAGVLLLIGSRAVARGNKRALHVVAPLLGLSVLLHLLRGPDYAGAIAEAVILVTVLARREELPYSGDPRARAAALWRLGGSLLAAVLYGVAALWTYRTAASLPFRPYQALADTFRALVGLAPRSGQYVPGDFSFWFRFSVLLIAVIGICWAAEVWTRPWRQRFRPSTRRRRQAAARVRRWGDDTLAPFALRADKEWFIAGQALITYRVVRGVALMSGDPIGPPAAIAGALAEFRADAHEHGWTVGVLGASERSLPMYEERGFRHVYHGDESVVDVGAFSLTGRRKRAVRQAARRLDRQGYQAQILLAGETSPQIRAELSDAEQAWLRGRERTGFTMELDSLFRLGGDDEVFVIGRDPDGAVAGFLHLAVCRAGDSSTSLTLSSMPRRPGTPNGLNAWLIVNVISWARARGYSLLSLNFSPFARLLSPGGAASRRQRALRWVLLGLKGILGLQLDNLLRFNEQFCPDSVPRFILVERWADLPKVVIAAMAAEGYLPRARLVRGADWIAEPVSSPAISEPAALSVTGSEQ